MESPDSGLCQKPLEVNFSAFPQRAVKAADFLSGAQAAARLSWNYARKRSAAGDLGG